MLPINRDAKSKPNLLELPSVEPASRVPMTAVVEVLLLLLTAVAATATRFLSKAEEGGVEGGDNTLLPLVVTLEIEKDILELS